MRSARSLVILLLLGLVLPTLGGCATVRVTTPERTATEQFLLSEAAIEAVQQLSPDALRDRAVYVDERYFESYDGEFIVGELRAHLLLNGVRLVERRRDAQLVLEARSGGVGVDRYDYLLGIPQVLLPAGQIEGVETGDGTIILPELALIKRIRQRGFASVALVAYWRDSGEIIASSGPFIGHTERDDWWFFGFGPRSSGDIPTIEEDP